MYGYYLFFDILSSYLMTWIVFLNIAGREKIFMKESSVSKLPISLLHRKGAGRFLQERLPR